LNQFEPRNATLEAYMVRGSKATISAVPSN